MASIQSKVAKALFRWYKKHWYHQRIPLYHMRPGMERLMRLLPSPRSCIKTWHTLGDLEALCVQPKTKNTKAQLLYLHGGGYAMGSAKTHWKMAGRIAQRTHFEVWIPNYRLAPEQPYPAALEDALTAWEAMEQRFAGEPLFLAGDSAGGGLALSLLFRLKERGKPMPKATYLISPWCDLSGQLPGYDRQEQKDPFLDRASLARFAKFYAGTQLKNPEISPVFNEARDLGPILLQAGGDELLLPDALAMERLLKEGNTDVDLEIYPDMFHVFQAGDGVLPEAKKALNKAGNWLLSHL